MTEFKRKRGEAAFLSSQSDEYDLAGGKYTEKALLQALEALQRRNYELALLHRAGQAFNSTLDLDQVLATVLEEVRLLLNAVACSVWLVDPESGQLVCRQATGIENKVVRGWQLAPGEGIVGWVAQNARVSIVPDARDDDRHFTGIDERTGLEMRAILSVPLETKGRVIGVLQVLDTEENRFSPTDLTLVEPLAAAAATAIDNARLVNALRRRTVDLERRNEELDAFAHTVAHDLKIPLGYIVGFAEALRECGAEMTFEDICHHLQTIAWSGRKMEGIIDGLLLLAGVRLAEVELEPLDMADILTEVEERLVGLIAKYQAEIIHPASWPTALGYGPWVEEVWANYLTNGIKYGGSPPRLELGATERADGSVRFWVRDNGAGLTAEEQARLFTPLWRPSQSGPVIAEGYGLGLSIVRRIVEKLGGEVGVESRVGEGSRFSFTLPAAA